MNLVWNHIFFYILLMNIFNNIIKLGKKYQKLIRFIFKERYNILKDSGYVTMSHFLKSFSSPGVKIRWIQWASHLQSMFMHLILKHNQTLRCNVKADSSLSKMVTMSRDIVTGCVTLWQSTSGSIASIFWKLTVLYG